METSTVEQRVANGARWLDENFPGWEARVNPDTLLMHDGSRCICGQVFEEERKNLDLYMYDGYSYASAHLFREAIAWLETTDDGRFTSYGALDQSMAYRLGFTIAYHPVSNGGGLSQQWGTLQEVWTKLLHDRSMERWAQGILEA